MIRYFWELIDDQINDTLPSQLATSCTHSRVAFKNFVSASFTALRGWYKRRPINQVWVNCIFFVAHREIDSVKRRTHARDWKTQTFTRYHCASAILLLSCLCYHCLCAWQHLSLWEVHVASFHVDGRRRHTAPAEMSCSSHLLHSHTSTCVRMQGILILWIGTIWSDGY